MQSRFAASQTSWSNLHSPSRLSPAGTLDCYVLAQKVFSFLLLFSLFKSRHLCDDVGSWLIEMHRWRHRLVTLPWYFCALFDISFFVSIIRDGEASIAGICLVQAVRSFLHFSQLSAWLNKSSGSRPQQLLYRVTMPGQAFTSKFASKPVDHHFPLAHVGRLATHAIKVRFLFFFFWISPGLTKIIIFLFFYRFPSAHFLERM